MTLAFALPGVRVFGAPVSVPQEDSDLRECAGLHLRGIEQPAAIVRVGGAFKYLCSDFLKDIA